MDKSYFNSKVLLFGEYSVIKDSMALSIPYEVFGGKLSFKTDMSIDPEIRDFSKFLKQLLSTHDLPFNFEMSTFEFDMGRGLYFDSSIPQGYGLGSSGALVAAIFARYVKDYSVCENKIKELKEYFSMMESYFHGSSSGVDPLISFFNAPMLINGENAVEQVQIPEYNLGKGAIFLLNTGRPRRTEPLVNLFLEKCKDKKFNKLCENVLIPITNGCITSFLQGNESLLFEFFRQLSDFQGRHFAPMIPKLYQDLWKKGLDEEIFYLKLCGAGGGGFILGMTKDYEKTAEILGHYEIRSLLRVRPSSKFSN